MLIRGILKTGKKFIFRRIIMFCLNKQAKLGLLCILLVINAIPAAAGARPTDREITRWVQEALKTDYRIGNSNIKVTTDAGIVTLSGEATTLVAKKYADLEARKIRGVIDVVNKIDVLALYRSDTDIQRDLRLRYINSLDPDLQKITVHVSDGRVTLSGQLDSESQRRRAGLIATELQGVKAVNNNLAVVVKQPRTDQEVRQDILNALGRDVYFADVVIDVHFHSGIVILTGKVDTAYQKKRAAEDCLLIADVKAVKNYLVTGREHDTGIRTKTPVPTDTQLENNVREALFQDLHIINPFRIEVEAKDGRVTLRGVVASLHQQSLAVQDAYKVVGVFGVTDLTSIGTERQDANAVYENIRFALSTDSELNKFNISIAVKNGIIILSGDVKTAYEKTHAANIASRIKGVRRYFVEETVYTLKIVRRGRLMPKALQTNFYLLKQAKKAMKTNFSIIHATIDINDFAHLVSAHRGITHFLVEDKGEIAGYLTRDAALEVYRRNSSTDTIPALMWKDYLAIAGDRPLSDVVDGLRSVKASIVLVTTENDTATAGNVSGFITKDLIVDSMVDDLALFTE